MKNTKNRENETMSKFNDFLSKINKSKNSANDTTWLSKPLKFHIDSEKAYNVQKAKEYESSVGTGKNYEDFLTKGNTSM